MSWTCNVKEWRRLQTATTREENKSNSSNGAGKPANQMDELLHKALATDGMLMEMRGVSVETAEKHRKSKRAVKTLTPEEIEQLGTRAQPKGIPDSYYNGFPASLDGVGKDIPPYFPDIEECLTKCTWGATYGRRYSGDELHLWCFNKEHFEEKKAKGRKDFETQFAEQRKEQDDQDLELVRVIESKLGDDPQLAVAISTALLIAQDRFFRLTPTGQRSMQEFRYNPMTILALAKTLDVKIETGDYPHNEPSPIDANDAIHALESVSGIQAASVAGLLIAWLARAFEVESNGENPGLSVTDMLSMFQAEHEIEGGK